MDYAKILSGWQKSKPITHSGQRVFFACDGRRAAAYARPGLLHQVEPICPANLARGSKRSQLRCFVFGYSFWRWQSLFQHQPQVETGEEFTK